MRTIPAGEAMTNTMALSMKTLWFSVLAAALLLLPSRAAAQSATVTDDAFLSTNSTTQSVNLNGQGISLLVAGLERHGRLRAPGRHENLYPISTAILAPAWGLRRECH